MNKLKENAILVVLLIVIILIILAYFGSKSWPIRFHRKLDAFFGKDNWEWVSTEKKESVSYKESSEPGSGPMRYKEWYIETTNRYGETETWRIFDLAFKIRQRENNPFKFNRFTARRALILELRDISFDIVSEEIYKEILLEILPEAEAACFEVNISYRGGNPPLKMLDKLIKQPWFIANQIKAEDYLKTDLYDFYITMRTYSYDVEKLTEDEQEHLKGSLEEIEQALDEKYGEYADYEIHISD